MEEKTKEKGEILVLKISGKTKPIKKELENKGFSWNAKKCAWLKTGTEKDRNAFEKEAKEIWASLPGKILFALYFTEEE